VTDFISNTIQAHIVHFDDTEGYKHLVLKRAEHNRVYPGLWQVVTGRIETGEKAVDTAKREAEEETGLRFLDIWTLPYTANFFNPYRNAVSIAPVFGFLSESLNVQLSIEHEAYEWMDMNAAIDRVILPTHKEGIRIFNDYILSKEDKSLFRYKNRK